MDFVGEVEIEDDKFISFNSLRYSNIVDIKRLKSLIQAEGAYAYMLNGNNANPIPAHFDSYHIEPTEWEQFYFSKKELQKYGLIPIDDDTKKSKRTKTLKDSMDRYYDATYCVGRWIGENGLQPNEITKTKIQDYLGQKGFGFGSTAIFKSVWEAIPHPNKNTSGRPPKK